MDYDQAARYAILYLDPEGFLAWFLPAALRAWRWVRWLKTELIAFPGEPERRCDTVAVLESRDADDPRPPVALVVECQTRPRGDMPERQRNTACECAGRSPSTGTHWCVMMWWQRCST
jgi:hypothetical protein